MKINGHEYSKKKVLKALKNKGYFIFPFEYQFEDETFPGGIEIVTITTECAVKTGEKTSEKNIWQNVAIKEFQKGFVKPPLV